MGRLLSDQSSICFSRALLELNAVRHNNRRYSALIRKTGRKTRTIHLVRNSSRGQLRVKTYYATLEATISH